MEYKGFGNCVVDLRRLEGAKCLDKYTEVDGEDGDVKKMKIAISATREGTVCQV